MENGQPGGDTFGRRFERLQASEEQPSGGQKAGSAGSIPPTRTIAIEGSGLGEPGVDGLSGWLGESFMAGALYVLACLVVGLGVLGGLHGFTEAALGSRGVHAAEWIELAGWIIGGLSLSAGLVAGAVMLSAIARQRRQVRDLVGDLADLASRVEKLGHLIPDPQLMDQLRDRLDQLSQSIADVAHNSLLDEAGRAEKRRRLAERERDAAVEQIRREMTAGQWDRARAAMERFRANFPSEAELAARLSEELDRRREQAEAEDVAAARAQCDELLSVSALDRAVAVAQELVQQHPDSTAAKGLLARVERERKMAQEQQRLALYTEIERHITRREWQDALRAGRDLVERFPDSIDAEAVKAQMETLRANAEIQYRQNIERTITDRVRRQRYADAVQLAEELINAFPNSPQAGILKAQLPVLKERAAEAARESRKRQGQVE